MEPKDYHRICVETLPAQASSAVVSERNDMAEKCPKCGGVGQLLYNPLMPFSDLSSTGPWKCPACENGILYASMSERERRLEIAARRLLRADEMPPSDAQVLEAIRAMEKVREALAAYEKGIK